MLFGLWKAAGRSVNLWDWLEGFRETIHVDNDEDQDDEKKDKDGESAILAVDRGARKSKRKREASPPPIGEQNEEAEQNDEKDSARLHATFIRFCEEARMLGLVRARGKGTGRRADEVIKGIGMV